MDIIRNLEALLAKGQDSALIRYSLGTEYRKVKKFADAITHLARAVALDPGYSAAWKMYGKTLMEDNQVQDAIKIFEQGIAAAETKGDIQAAKEMRVYLNRLRK